MLDERSIDGYTFWPTKKVDILFSRKISYKRFFWEMKKLYERASLCNFDIAPELENAVSELPIKKQLELLQTIKVRTAAVGKKRKNPARHSRDKKGKA